MCGEVGASGVCETLSPGSVWLSKLWRQSGFFGALEAPTVGAVMRLGRREVTISASSEDPAVLMSKCCSECRPVPPLPDTLAGKEMTQSVEGQVWKP